MAYPGLQALQGLQVLRHPRHLAPDYSPPLCYATGTGTGTGMEPTIPQLDNSTTDWSRVGGIDMMYSRTRAVPVYYSYTCTRPLDVHVSMDPWVLEYVNIANIAIPTIAIWP